jgi:hypothetical protein
MNFIRSNDIFDLGPETGIDVSVAHDKLTGFQSADELAEFFKQEGIQGSCGLATSCAIAKWMQQTTGRLIAVSKDEMWDETDEDIDYLTAKDKLVKHNEVLSDFVFKFDRGYYPELVNDYEHMLEH